MQKASNLVINNNSPIHQHFAKTKVIYQFKCPLGDCISENNNVYVGLTSTTQSRRLIMHLTDTSSIAQHLEKHSCLKTEFRKIFTENTEQQNNRLKLQILEVLHIRKNLLKLTRIYFESFTNVLKCLLLLLIEQNLEINATTIHRYK